MHLSLRNIRDNNDKINSYVGIIEGLDMESKVVFASLEELVHFAIINNNSEVYGCVGNFNYADVIPYFYSGEENIAYRDVSLPQYLDTMLLFVEELLKYGDKYKKFLLDFSVSVIEKIYHSKLELTPDNFFDLCHIAWHCDLSFPYFIVIEFWNHLLEDIRTLSIAMRKREEYIDICGMSGIKPFGDDDVVQIIVYGNNSMLPDDYVMKEEIKKLADTYESVYGLNNNKCSACSFDRLFPDMLIENRMQDEMEDEEQMHID